MLLIVAGWGSAAGAASCPTGPVPAATLLVPYFEVDLASADGPTTLFAVTNTAEHAVLAHVVLWTDWALPTLAFDLALSPDDVQTMNLRDLFAGALPSTGGASFSGCTNPITLPSVDVEALRKQHTGQPDAQDHCSGSGRRGPDVATGFVTIDVANACSASIRYPNQNGYFESGGSGIASNENVLLGDLFWLDAASDLAIGNEAVHVVADQDRFGGEASTFYGVWNNHSGVDARSPLGTRYRTRYLGGDLFPGGTDLFIWAEPDYETAVPVHCGERADAVSRCQTLNFVATDESVSPAWYSGLGPVTEVATRFAVGSSELPVPASFGFVDVENRLFRNCDLPIPPPPGFIEPLQLVVLPLVRAEGKFAVGFNAHKLGDLLCPP